MWLISLLLEKVSMRIHQKRPREFTKTISTKKRGILVDNKNSPILSTRIRLLWPLEFFYPYTHAEMFSCWNVLMPKSPCQNKAKPNISVKGSLFKAIWLDQSIDWRHRVTKLYWEYWHSKHSDFFQINLNLRHTSFFFKYLVVKCVCRSKQASTDRQLTNWYMY